MSLMTAWPRFGRVYGFRAISGFVMCRTGAFGFLVSAWFGNFSLGASGALLGLVESCWRSYETRWGGAYMSEFTLKVRAVRGHSFLFSGFRRGDR